MIHPGCSRVLPTRSPEHKAGTQQWPGPGPRLPAQKPAGQPWRLGALGSWQEQEVEQGGPGSPSPWPSQHMGTGFLPGCVTLSRVTALPGLERDPSSWAQGRRLLAPGLSHPAPGAAPPLCAGASGGPEKQQHPSLDNEHARPEGHWEPRWTGPNKGSPRIHLRLPPYFPLTLTVNSRDVQWNESEGETGWRAGPGPGHGPGHTADSPNDIKWPCATAAQEQSPFPRPLSHWGLDPCVLTTTSR